VVAYVAYFTVFFFFFYPADLRIAIVKARQEALTIEVIEGAFGRTGMLPWAPERALAGLPQTWPPPPAEQKPPVGLADVVRRAEQKELAAARARELEQAKNSATAAANAQAAGRLRNVLLQMAEEIGGESPILL
jgi:hypothetical protein